MPSSIHSVVTPVADAAVPQRPLDRRGAAVVGQQRAVQVDRSRAAARASSSGARIAPNATTANRSGRRRCEALASTRARSRARASAPSSPSASPRAATAEAPRCRPRPLGRSGCVTTADHVAARAPPPRSDGTANSGVPMNTTRGRLSARLPDERRRPIVLGQLAARERLERALQELALERRQPVDEQHAVEVIDLVLDRAREEALGLELERAAVLVVRLDRDARARARRPRRCRGSRGSPPRRSPSPTARRSPD